MAASRIAPPAHETVIVIPTLDEAEHIAAVLDTLRHDCKAAPVLVVDGRSRDATRDIVRARMARDRNLYLVDNPRRVQAAAVNLGARIAREMGARVLVRVDAHARYPAGFIPGIVAALEQSGANSVVVPLIAAGAPGWQAAAAALQRSWLGHGGAAHRRSGCRGWVEHGHHAAFRLERFLALGGYDARLPACEDVEFDMRLGAAGGRIWMEDRWPVSYRPRKTPLGLWRQMRRNGRWRMTVARLRASPLRPRQLAPLVAAAGTLLSLVGGAAWHASLAMPALGYVALVQILALRGSGLRYAPRVAFLAVVSHFAYALGAAEGLCSGAVGSEAAARLKNIEARLGALGRGMAA